ncbi:MAG: MotA/TolQ/ExbB proton channel family protein [Verrucomicrobium sp.]|nr:MotA/TolQ/ExbB proton channel family protein [Verrucomicrobium sp.]
MSFSGEINSIAQFFSRGGVFMLPIIFASILSLAVILERAFALRRSLVINPRLADAIETLRHGQSTVEIEGLLIEGGDRTVLDRLVRLALFNLPWSKVDNAEALQTRARSELVRLERGLVILEVCVGIGPLLGLLGTVSGLIVIFGNVGDQQIASQGVAIARGISEALNTTVAGLLVAIPALVAFSIYSRRVENYAVELEGYAADLLAKVYTQSAEAEPASAS